MAGVLGASARCVDGVLDVAVEPRQPTQTSLIAHRVDQIEDIGLLSTEEHRIRNDSLKLASMYFGAGMENQGYEHLQAFFSHPLSRKKHFIFLKYIHIDRNFDKYKNSSRFKSIIFKGGS